MKKNLLIVLVVLMFLATGIGSAFAESVTTEKSAVKTVVEKTVCCTAENAECKEKCICTDCKGDGKCDAKCECCCKDGVKCSDNENCKDAKKADCGAAKGCGAMMKTGCGMKKK